MKIFSGLCLLVFLVVPSAFSETPAGYENRCGWLDNPTPANWWLTDKDGEWELGVQGGYQMPDESWDRLPKIPENGKYWKKTNVHYGYGCACLLMKVDKKEKRVLQVKGGQALPLAKCRADKTLKSEDR